MAQTKLDEAIELFSETIDSTDINASIEYWKNYLTTSENQQSDKKELINYFLENLSESIDNTDDLTENDKAFFVNVVDFILELYKI